MMNRATWHDAYDSQMSLWQWYRTTSGAGWMRHNYGINARPLSPQTRDLLARLYNAEAQKVLVADPYFVSSEMVDVIDAASESFAPEAILPTDFLTSHGFVWYERPFEIVDRFDEEFLLRGFSWCPILTGDVPDSMLTPDNASDQGMALTIYADHEASSIGFFPAHLTPWWYGMEFDGNEVDENDRPTGALWWWRIAQTTLRLMQQKIAVQHLERPGRATRRAGQRSGWDPEGEREILVVRLRRERGEAHEPSGEEAGYSHRFIVGGHWRNQWYPSGNVHRQIWISPYVKGPDDKPLVVKPSRAFTWDR